MIHSHHRSNVSWQYDIWQLFIFLLIVGFESVVGLPIVAVAFVVHWLTDRSEQRQMIIWIVTGIVFAVIYGVSFSKSLVVLGVAAISYGWFLHKSPVPSMTLILLSTLGAAGIMIGPEIKPLPTRTFVYALISIGVVLIMTVGSGWLRRMWSASLSNDMRV